MDMAQVYHEWRSWEGGGQPSAGGGRRSSLDRRMAPSIGGFANISSVNLFCAEEVDGGMWDDDGDDEEEEGEGEESGEVLKKVTQKKKLTDCHPPVVFLDFPVEDDEAISVLMLKEACYMTDAEYSGKYRSRSLNAEARQNAIRWMLKVGNLSFCCGTFALAVLLLEFSLFFVVV